MKRFQWVADRPVDAIALAAAGPRILPAPDPRLSVRDELIFLLHTAGEIEHSLMVQYLYAASSIPGDVADPAMKARLAGWRSTIMLVAKQEMGHFMTVQNLLRALGAPLNLDREDYPFRSEFYPFPFRLEPLSKASLARYVIAEMPEGLPAAEVAAVQADAQIGAGGTAFNRVGLLYEQIIKLVTQSTTDADFHPSSRPYQGASEEWGDADLEVFVRVAGSRTEALAALTEIATQGEGAGGPPPAGDTTTHFGKFREIYLAWTGTEPILKIPTDPSTESQAASGAEAGRITHPVSRKVGQLFNNHYRALLFHIAHHLHTPPKDDDDPGRDTGRGVLIGRAFSAMTVIGRWMRLLSSLPLAAPVTDARAAAPFETPFSLGFPQGAFAWWLWQKDLAENTRRLVEDSRAELDKSVDLAPAQVAALKTQLELDKKAAEAAMKQTEEYLRSYLKPEDDTSVKTILELRIFPPLGLARFGSSSEPMDNYEFGPAGANGFRTLRPAETLTVDPVSGTLTAAVPAALRFRDAAGKIRPVCPFFEVWARFADGADFKPVTREHLAALGLSLTDVKWSVRAANLKAARRTGDAGDRVQAQTGTFSDTAIHPLTGTATNFKVGKSIPFGSVRFVQPTPEFPEIRLRFTPSGGRVYGPTADPEVVDDVYDETRGQWKGYNEDQQGIPIPTVPNQIYAQAHPAGDNNGTSLGYLDDSCDGVIEVEIPANSGGQPCRAKARFSAGPPHFAPDSLPVRSLNDDLLQIVEGITLSRTVEKAEVIDILQRAVETMRLMQTDTLNRGYARNAFPPLSAEHATVIAMHTRFLQALDGLDAPVGTPARSGAINVLRQLISVLRGFEQTKETTIPESRRRMPALMRGPDGGDLALPRHQIEILKTALAQAEGAAPAPTPEADMLKLVASLAASPATPVFHGNVQIPGGTLADLFIDPPRLLLHLRTQTARTDLPTGIKGTPLVVPGDPAASAFFRIIQSSSHPMREPFSRVVPGLNKTGIEIVEAWIRSLT